MYIIDDDMLGEGVGKRGVISGGDVYLAKPQSLDMLMERLNFLDASHRKLDMEITETKVKILEQISQNLNMLKTIEDRTLCYQVDDMRLEVDISVYKYNGKDKDWDYIM